MADRYMNVEVLWDARWDEVPEPLPFDLDSLEDLQPLPAPATNTRHFRGLSSKEKAEIDAEFNRELRNERIVRAVENASLAFAIAATGTVAGTWIASELLLRATIAGWL